MFKMMLAVLFVGALGFAGSPLIADTGDQPARRDDESIGKAAEADGSAEKVKLRQPETRPEPTQEDFSNPEWVERHTGGLPAPESQQKLDEERELIPQVIKPTALGLKRINDSRAKLGKAPLTMKEAVAQAEERAEKRVEAAKKHREYIKGEDGK